MSAAPQIPPTVHRWLVDYYLALRAVASGRFTERQDLILFRRRCPATEEALPAATEIRAFTSPDAFLDLADAGYDLASPADHANAVTRFFPGGQLYAVFIDKKLAHFSRVMADRHDPNFGPYLGEMGAAADICIGPCETLPAFRGRGLYAAALRRICAEAGPCDAFIYCAATNTASVKGIRKASFTEIGRIVRRRILFWSRTKFTPSPMGPDV